MHYYVDQSLKWDGSLLCDNKDDKRRPARLSRLGTSTVKVQTNRRRRVDCYVPLAYTCDNDWLVTFE